MFTSSGSRRSLVGRVRFASLGVAIGLVAAGLAGCEQGSTVTRINEPVVLTGTSLPALVGQDPQRIVAFAHVRVDGTPTWRQIPVQVDERKVVGFGQQPPNNTTAGVPGTVYGYGTSGVTTLQYTDASTFVGADTNTTFDTDDELVFMASDAGGPLEAGDQPEPAGVVPGVSARVHLADPLVPGAAGDVYLFTSTTLDPAAGRDYVHYDFRLTSGSYQGTYRRATGPNPETSSVTTDTYRIGYSDRWIEDAWQIHTGAATGVDVLDGSKDQFAIDNCGRSNATFSNAEGAFVANIDGPVRGIRSYVGANSGPLTQRTHFMYRDTERVVTDLRVHPIPQIMSFLDMSAAAIGMTYRSSTLPGGVSVDGVNDPVGAGLNDWEMYNGAQGSIITTGTFESSINPPGGFVTKLSWFYRDETSPAETQCWGDGSLTGAAGPVIGGGIGNTDPRTAPFDTLRATRTVVFGAPADPAQAAGIASTVSDQVHTPLTVSVLPT